MTGKVFLFEFIVAPNCFKGSVTLEKSLIERLLSPSILISFLESTSSPKINLAKVPEFPAFRLIFLWILMN